MGSNLYVKMIFHDFEIFSWEILGFWFMAILMEGCNSKNEKKTHAFGMVKLLWNFWIFLIIPLHCHMSSLVNKPKISQQMISKSLNIIYTYIWDPIFSIKTFVQFCLCETQNFDSVHMNLFLYTIMQCVSASWNCYENYVMPDGSATSAAAKQQQQN